MDKIFAWIARHRRLVMLGWLVITVVGVLIAPSVSGRLHSGTTVSSAGYTANSAALRKFGGIAANASVVVLDLPAGQTVSTAGMKQRLAAVDRAVPLSTGVRAISFASTGSPALVGRGGTSTILLVYPPLQGVVDQPVLDTYGAAAAAAIPGVAVHTTGLEQLSGGASSGGSSVLLETLIGALAALVILAWVFGSVIALIPLLTAFVSILTMQLAVWALTYTTSMSFNPAVQFIVVILGLGLSIDYGLLIVTRWREERRLGADNATAVALACRHAGHAVAVSGFTAAIGLLAMAIIPVSTIRGFGISGLFIPSIAALVSLTLLPAVLRSVGPKLDWPRFRLHRPEGDRWDRWAQLVVQRKVLATAAGILVLGVLGSFALQLNVAQPTASSLAATGAAREGLNQLHTDGFGDGTMTTMAILTPPEADPGAVAARISQVSGIRGEAVTSGAQWQAADGTRVVMVLPQYQTGASGNGAVLTDVRAAAPSADSVAGVQVEQVDIAAITYQWFPLMLAIVALITFLFLARALRSMVLPLKAVILNLLSVAATYGVVVLVWQKGLGSQAIWGLPSTGAIGSLTPVLLFGFLFGLSMDYEVFILTRMREAYDRTGDTSRAVVEGIGRTGRLVTSAALILFCALISLSSAPDPTVKIIATGLAAGILIDATIVRSLLAPAVVALLGKANWWTPTWFRRHSRITPTADGPKQVPAVPAA